MKNEKRCRNLHPWGLHFWSKMVLLHTASAHFFHVDPFGSWKFPGSGALRLVDGILMPSIGMGLVCRDGNKCHNAQNSAETFLRLGGRLLDTAPTYGHGRSHRLLGQALRSSVVSREDIWIVSKVPAAKMGYNTTLQCVRHTLAELGVSYLDVALIHRPNNAAVEKKRTIYLDQELRLSTWRALQEARRLGLIRYAGVSNFGPSYLNEL